MRSNEGGIEKLKEINFGSYLNYGEHQSLGCEQYSIICVMDLLFCQPLL